MVYNRGSIDDQKLFAPHGVNWVDEMSDHLIIFNNGYLRPNENNNDIPYSSIEEIVTPLIEGVGYVISDDSPYGPDNYFWYYTDNQSFSNIQSGAFRLENGNTLITYTTLSKIIEVSNDLDIVWEYNYPDDGMEYLSRASRYNGIFHLGDINYDFTIDVLDIVNISNLILYSYQYTDIADMNSDYIIDILDIISIVNIIINNN